MSRDTQRVVAMLALATLAGCGSSPTPAGPPSGAATFPSAQAGAPGQAQAASGPFLLTITAPRLTWAVNEPIDLTASLADRGDAPTVALAGSGSGLVGFALSELTGRRHVDGGQTDDCKLYELNRDSPLTRHYVKSGGFSGEDPDREWLKQFFSDPQLRLPAGRWRVWAYADFFEQTCGMDQIHHQIRASLELTVT